jgi:hypothetical protein
VLPNHSKARTVVSYGFSISLSLLKTFENLLKTLLMSSQSKNVDYAFTCAFRLQSLLICSKRRQRTPMCPKYGHFILYVAERLKRNHELLPCGLSVSPLLSMTIEYTLKTIWGDYMSKSIVQALTFAFCLQSLLLYSKERRSMPHMSKMVPSSLICGGKTQKCTLAEHVFSVFCAQNTTTTCLCVCPKMPRRNCMYPKSQYGFPCV